MGDISVIARRLKDGHVQYGWSGNGGYCSNTGVRLLAWYNTPDQVEYLFGLGQVGGLGPPGSEFSHTFPRNEPTGTPHWLGTSETQIFRQIAFVDYGYFYDVDNHWYYICPGKLCIKLPLEMVVEHLEDGLWGPQEYTFLKKIQLLIVKEIVGALFYTDDSFRRFAEELKYTPEAMDDISLEAEKQFTEGCNSLHWFGKNHRRLLDWLDDWVLVRPTGDGTSVQIILKPKGEQHIETNEW